MKICLINPPILHKGISFARAATPPLGLAYIAGTLKAKGHTIQVIDAAAEIHSKHLFKDDIYLIGLSKEEISELIDKDTDVIGFTFMFVTNWLYDRELIAYVKTQHPNAVLIAGGEHANASSEYCLSQAPLDFIVRGEGEETIVELLDAIRQRSDLNLVNGLVYRDSEKNVITNKPRKRRGNINQIPWPAWEYFPLSTYFSNKISFGVYRGNTLPVNATRGCPYECTFCSNPQMWGRKYEMRTPEDFVDELEFLKNEYGVENFDLYDLTAIIVKSWILAMCKEIVRRNLKITFQLPSGTRSEVIDFEVAQWLYRSGCKNISYAPESGSVEVLKKIKKKVLIRKMLKSIKDANDAGLNIKLNLIMGFPDDRHRDIWLTFKFLIQASWYGAYDAAPAVFSPYPGSSLFDRLTKEGKVNIYDDAYLYEIIDIYDLLPPKVYCNNISSRSMRLYIFIFLIIFYGSNYLFRPARFFKTFYNIIRNKHESRIEHIIYNNFLKHLVVLPNLLLVNLRKNRLIRMPNLVKDSSPLVQRDQIER